MTNVHSLLPRLCVNRRLLQAIVDEPRPCCAMGFVEERRRVLPLVALGLPEVGDLATLGDGFRLGHQVATTHEVEALLLDFEFQGRAPLRMALDPTSVAVQRVLGAIAECEAYFILVIGAGGVTTFRADADAEDQRRFAELCRRNPRATSHPDQFNVLEQTLRASAQRWLFWLGGDDPSLLDLSEADRYELRPMP